MTAIRHQNLLHYYICYIHPCPVTARQTVQAFAFAPNFLSVKFLSHNKQVTVSCRWNKSFLLRERLCQADGTIMVQPERQARMSMARRITDQANQYGKDVEAYQVVADLAQCF